jgi:hypothetical protein
MLGSSLLTGRGLAYYDEYSITHDATILLGSIPLRNAEQAEDANKGKKGVSAL